MTVTLTHKHGHKCALIAALGLDHDTPLIEWHDWRLETEVVARSALGSTWRYAVGVSGTGPADPDFDDSAWSTGPTPFSWGYPGVGGVAVPSPMNVWYRQQIQTTGGDLTLSTYAADNDTYVYLDGVLVWHPTYSAHAPVVVPCPAGDHVVAVHGTDDGASGGYSGVVIEETVAGGHWSPNADRTTALISYQAKHGRPTPTQNTEALSVGVALARTLLDAIPASGDRFRLTLNAAVAAALGVTDPDELPRFTGEITDLEVDARGDLSTVTLAGLGRRARLNRQPVSMDRPEESDGERVRRTLAQVEIVLPLDVGTIEPGTVTLLESSPRAVPAQQLIDGVTADSLGQIVEHRSGRLDYQDADHRRGLASRTALTGTDHLIQPFTWRQGIASVINDATATYGPDRDQVRVVDAASADPDTGNGPYGVQIDTQLAGELDAYALLTNVVGRYSRPSWWLPSVLVELYRTAGTQLAALLQLSHGDKITASDLPPDGAFTAGDVFVEGTTETHDARGWRFELVVADPRLAGAGVRWIDLPRFLRWEDVDPMLTWLDLATITDPYSLGTPVAGGGDSDDTAALIVSGGDSTTTTWDYVLSGALP